MVEAEFYPTWMTHEIETALRKLTGRYARKKRITILRLAEGLVLGRSMVATFALGDTCSETTWYGRYVKGRKLAGWRDDPRIKTALRLALDRAHYTSDGYIAEQIGETRRLLAKYGPGAVHKLGLLMTGAESENLQRNASLDILDRLDADTASKGPPGGATAAPQTIIYLPDNRREPKSAETENPSEKNQSPQSREK